MDWFIKIETAMRLDLIVPVNHRINRSEFLGSPFHLAKESLDLAVGLGMIHPRPDMSNRVIFKEFSE